MFWLGLIGILLLVVIALCAVALVDWARLAVGALNNVSELLLDQRRWPAAHTTLKTGFKTGNSDRAN